MDFANVTLVSDDKKILYLQIQDKVVMNVEKQVCFSNVIRGNMDLANVTLVRDDNKKVQTGGMKEGRI